VTTDATGGPPVSERMRLARLAEQAIARTPGVDATSGPAGRWRTSGAQQVVCGVVAAEDGRGRVEIELHLVARWPLETSLEQLAGQVRARLRRSADMAAMGERLGAVSAAFEDLLTEGERI
jgi:hypothetical protein